MTIGKFLIYTLKLFSIKHLTFSFNKQRNVLLYKQNECTLYINTKKDSNFILIFYADFLFTEHQNKNCPTSIG